MDGPVVKAARRALEAGDVKLVLPFLHEDGEDEVRQAFAKVLDFTRDGAAAREVAELYFFETVVRVHRVGEGAAFTGLKPAGLDVGPVIPVAERAIDSGSPDELSEVLCEFVRGQVARRLRHVTELKGRAGGGMSDAREYTSAMLGLQVWANGVYRTLEAGPHGENVAHVD
jgi:hypothetical protein